MGVREVPGTPLTTTLVDYLTERQLLLVLDNCEHLLEASATLAATLLRRCPQLRVLATSRQALGVLGELGELIYRVPSLMLPDIRRLPPIEYLAGYEAVRLFLERARLVNPGFALTSQNALSLAQIVCGLDGMPLPIELAAARIGALSVEQIAARLDDRFNLLSTGTRTAAPRHQTLRLLVDWSYDLLSETEQVLFQRLAVFTGGWTLEAAIRAALRWALESDDVATLMGISRATMWFWQVHRHFSEAEQWLEAALARCGDVPDADEADLLSVLGYLATMRAEYDRATSLQEWVLAIRREQGRPVDIGWSLTRLGNLAYHRGDFAAAGRYYAAGRDAFHLAGDQRGEAASLTNISYIATWERDFERAAAHCDAALVLYRQIGDERGAGLTRLARARVALSQAQSAGDAPSRVRPSSHRQVGPPDSCQRDLASKTFAEALRIFHTLGARRDAAGALEGIASVAAAQGQPAVVAELLGAAAAIRESIGAPISPVDQSECERILAAARAALGDEAFTERWRAGQALTFDEAVNAALAAAAAR